jgi:hypothetical protein
MKLLIRGGSIAAGFGVTKSYADILTQSLWPRGIEVVNRSRYRENSFNGIGTFNEDIENCRPDILLVQFGVDDAFSCVYRSEFQENIIQMIRLARLRFNPVIFLATSHTFDNPNEMDAVFIFYRSLMIVASDLNCELIPVHSYWDGYLEEQNLCSKDLTLSDSRYPNEIGHQVIANAMMKWLDRL